MYSSASELWKNSLGRECSEEDAEKFRRKLIGAYEGLHERSAMLADEIARDLPEFTVHNVAHSDALWGLADDVAGPGFELTPTEGFVFGAAALVHDLGMAAAAYVGPASIEEEPRWSDAIAAALSDKTGQTPTKDEIAAPDEDVIVHARAKVLRERHAEQAENLLRATWKDEDGTQYSLLEDQQLRDSLGSITGLIAHSHWWPVTKLGEALPEKSGAPTGAPPAWTIRPILLAALLRLADAIHLDASRAPRFLRSLRKIGKDAAPHWDFQALLNQPHVDEDRLVFTGSAPFPVAKAEAWWLCSDALSVANQELARVDALLADTQLPRFAARSVAGADDPAALAKLIPTDGWVPVDARVRVGDVVRLVEGLGGRELYGARPEAPLRELIQNGCDAVRARRAIDGMPNDWGQVSVSVSDLDGEGCRWLQVEDSGTGMSRQVMTQHLLDFGSSFWSSDRVLEEFPGLLSSGFQPTGRFGIGFFSTFMWGDQVDVISRRHDAARADTYVLEFKGGVGMRPLLRQASPSEQLRDPGTRIRVSLGPEPLWRLGIDADEPNLDSLQELCAWVAPAIDVDLLVSADGQEVQAVAASDWLEMPMDQFVDRVESDPVRRYGPFPKEPPHFEEGPEKEPETDEQRAEREAHELRQDEYAAYERDGLRTRARILKDDAGEIVGRLAITPRRRGGVTVIGGLRANDVNRACGVLLGRPTTASRNTGLPIVPLSVLSAWASEQADLFEGDTEDQLEVAAAVRRLGGDTRRLPIAQTNAGFLTAVEVESWAADREEIVSLQEATLNIDQRAKGQIELGANTLIVTSLAPMILGSTTMDHDEDASEWPEIQDDGEAGVFQRGSLRGGALKAVASAWGVSPAQLRRGGGRLDAVVGLRGEEEAKLEADLWRRNPPEAP